MFKFLKLNKGVTLVELIVALAISSIILTCVISIFSVGISAYQSSMDSFNATTTAQILTQKIQTRIKYATAITVNTTLTSDSSKVIGTNYLYSSSGSVLLKNGNTVSDTFPDVKSALTYPCSVTFDVSSAKSLDVTIKISKGSKVIYTTTTTIYIIGLDGVANSAIVDNTTSGSVGIEIMYQ
jgi:prepilin-type N-terminal cleavage/methylation domain-containing protein